MSKERIHKLLAATGLGSRRQIEQWIKEGQVQVNGQSAQLGQLVSPEDQFIVAGNVVKTQTCIASQVLMLHKPIGDWCTRVHHSEKPSVFKRLPVCEQGRWVSVGRLDVNTSGLLLFTNNGQWAHQLMHPSFERTRTYHVVVNKTITQKQVAQLQQGIVLKDGIACAQSVRLLSDSICEMVMQEGRWRVVRRLWQALGFKVVKLKRIEFASILLPKDLQPGQWRYVDPQMLPKELKKRKV